MANLHGRIDDWIEPDDGPSGPAASDAAGDAPHDSASANQTPNGGGDSTSGTNGQAERLYAEPHFDSIPAELRALDRWVA